MSTVKESTTDDFETITSKVQSALINCFSHLQWQFTDGVIKGARRAGSSEYLYEYHPNGDDAQVIRLVVKQKLEPGVDTLESIQKKAGRLELIRLAFPAMSTENLPTNWSFRAEKHYNEGDAPLKDVIGPYLFDKNGRIQFSILVPNVTIYAKNKATNEERSITVNPVGNGMIVSDLTIENSD